MENNNPNNKKIIKIDDPLDADIHFRVPRNIKKKWIKLCTEKGVRNASEILRFWFMDWLSRLR